MEPALESKMGILNSVFMIILQIVWVKNRLGNVDLIFLKTGDQSYLVKIFLIMLNKCSQDDIVHNFGNRSMSSRELEQIRTFKHTDGWPPIRQYIRYACRMSLESHDRQPECLQQMFHPFGKWRELRKIIFFFFKSYFEMLHELKCIIK